MNIDIITLTFMILFSYNIFSGIFSISYNTFIRCLEITISHNQVTRIIPFSLSKRDTARLRVLDLSHNQIQGEFPSHLTFISSLQIVDLSNNYLKGTIEDTFGWNLLESVSFGMLSSNFYHALKPI
jgi:hypothetical protein